jgi:hypothetical protein
MDDKRQEIEKTAYKLYEKGGRVSGQDMDHWFEAEKIVHSRHEATTSFKSKRTSSTDNKKTKSGSTKKRP